MEASYAIKFGIRLGNNAAETYEMVNTVCGQAITSGHARMKQTPAEILAETLIS